MRWGIKVALDPTPRQARLLASNAGAARFVFNLGLMHVKSQLNGLTSCGGKGKADWSMPALRRWWNEWKQELAPWWRENSKEAYTSGLQSLANAFANYFAWRDGERGGDRMGWPKPTKQAQDHAEVHVHDRIVRRRRPLWVETAAHRPRALHGERREADRRHPAVAHDHQQAQRALVCEPARRSPRPAAVHHIARPYGSGSGRQTHRHAQRRHHGREPAHVEGEHATATPHPTQAQPSQAGVETGGWKPSMDCRRSPPKSPANAATAWTSSPPCSPPPTVTSASRT